MKRELIALVAILGTVSVASAQQIGNRTTLNGLLLGGIRYTDAFEGYSVGTGSEDNTNVTTMNSGSVINGQGPGLLDPGVNYSTFLTGNDFSNVIQWNGGGYFGSNSREILSNAQGLEIDYTMAVNAMGIDVRAYLGFGDNFTANVFNGSTLIGTYSGALSNDGSSYFFGWQNAGGITSVILTDSVNGWSPIIDNHTYGRMVASPEPASMALLALGGFALIRRRRR